MKRRMSLLSVVSVLLLMGLAVSAAEAARVMYVTEDGVAVVNVDGDVLRVGDRVTFRTKYVDIYAGKGEVVRVDGGTARVRITEGGTLIGSGDTVTSDHVDFLVSGGVKRLPEPKVVEEKRPETEVSESGVEEEATEEEVQPTKKSTKATKKTAKVSKKSSDKDKQDYARKLYKKRHDWERGTPYGYGSSSSGDSYGRSQETGKGAANY